MWWFKVRRTHTILPAAFAIFFLLVLTVEDRVVLLPSVIAGLQHMALMLFVPIPLVAGLMLCLESRLAAPEASGIRTIRLMDASLVIATMTAAVALGLATGSYFDSPQTTAVGRNAVFLTGLMLCIRAVAGQPAVMAPVAWLMVVMFFGSRSGGDPYPWALLPEPPGALHAAVGTVLMFTAGIAALLLTPRTHA